MLRLVFKNTLAMILREDPPGSPLANWNQCRAGCFGSSEPQFFCDKFVPFPANDITLIAGYALVVPMPPVDQLAYATAMISSLHATGSDSPAIIFIEDTRQLPVSPPLNEHNRVVISMLLGKARFPLQPPVWRLQAFIRRDSDNLAIHTRMMSPLSE